MEKMISENFGKLVQNGLILPCATITHGSYLGDVPWVRMYVVCILHTPQDTLVRCSTMYQCLYHVPVPIITRRRCGGDAKAIPCFALISRQIQRQRQRQIQIQIKQQRQIPFRVKTRGYGKAMHCSDPASMDTLYQDNVTKRQRQRQIKQQRQIPFRVKAMPCSDPASMDTLYLHCSLIVMRHPLLAIETLAFRYAHQDHLTEDDKTRTKTNTNKEKNKDKYKKREKVKYQAPSPLSISTKTIFLKDQYKYKDKDKYKLV